MSEPNYTLEMIEGMSRAKISSYALRLASRVTELEAENSKLHDAILDLYNAHQDEALEIRLRECGRWAKIKTLVGEANDRAARAEVKP